MSAFADTSGLYPLLVENEEDHDRCAEAFRSLLEAGRPIWTSSYVVVETMALLQSRIGLEAVRDFEEHIFPLLSIEWVSPTLHRRGVERLLREDRRRSSLVDCVSIECMGIHGLRDVLGLDPHFEEAGAHLLPGRRR